MADETTNYAIPKPTVGGDNNTWGTKIRTALDMIDALLFGKVDKAGDTMEGPLVLAAGTLGEPALSFDGDADTGLYWIAAGRIGVVVNGSLVAEVDTNGVITALQGRVATNIVHKLQAFELDANNGGLDVYARAAGALAFQHRIGAKVGLGTNNPKALLHVAGNICGKVIDLGGGTSLDLRLGNYFRKAITANFTPTFDNCPVAADEYFGFTLETSNLGSYTYTPPANVKWHLNVQPSFSTGRDKVWHETRDGGATWDAWQMAKGMP